MSNMEVIPISAPDSMGVFRDTRVRTFFIVDDRLDEAKLRDALTRLIRDHWRKLGARIVQRKDGKLEYHVPEVFADDYELFRMSREDSDQPFAKAAASLDLNSATREGGVTVLPGVEAADALFRPSTWPQLLSQAPDTPLLLIHLSLFADATVITTSVPHVLGDQLGLANIIKAWLGLVENKIPPPWVGYNEDILPGQKPFSEYPRSEMFKRGRVRVRYPLERFFVLLLFIWELITEPKEAHHILFFPTPLVDSLRERHSNPPSPADKDADAPKLTNGDILTAIMTKLSRLPRTSPRTISLSQTINLRGRHPRLTDPQARAGYIHNALVYSTARFRYHPLTPLGDIARLNRQAVEGVAHDPEVMDVLLAVHREQERRGQAQHVCEPFEGSYHMTNWVPAWRDLDFGSVLDKEAGEARGGEKVGLLVLGDGQTSGSVTRYAANLMSKTEEGYWVNFGASTKTMAVVRKYLAEDPMLERL
ncbi:hypothetical protein BR93DRAFT_971877 [Coniochaeta sp. PMI_546]|nr:hypothetical protein BR93DRAFT_971877 [Coniochaeta sp. PMI_546]